MTEVHALHVGRTSFAGFLPREDFDIDYSFYAESVDAARASITNGLAAPHGTIFRVDGAAIEAMG